MTAVRWEILVPKEATVGESEKPKRRVNWRNVACLVALGSPLLYIGDHYLPHFGGPAVTSPEGRAIIREAIQHFLPELFAGGNIR